MKYRLMKLVDGEWYEWGVYSTPECLAKAAFFIGQSDDCNSSAIKVEVVE